MKKVKVHRTVRRGKMERENITEEKAARENIADRYLMTYLG